MSAGGEEEAVRRAWAQAVHDIHRAQEDGAGEHFRTVDENGTVWEGTMYRPPDGGPRIDFSVPPAPSSDPEVVQTVRDLFKGGQFYVVDQRTPDEEPVAPAAEPPPFNEGGIVEGRRVDLSSGVLIVPEELRAAPVRTPEENAAFLECIRAALISVTEEPMPVVCSPAEYEAARCSGRCVTAEDIGAPVEYSGMVAYPDPECPAHGDQRPL